MLLLLMIQLCSCLLLQWSLSRQAQPSGNADDTPAVDVADGADAHAAAAAVDAVVDDGDDASTQTHDALPPLSPLTW